MDLLKFFAILGSVAVFFVVLELIRRGRLKERYSLLWIFAALVMLFFSSSRKLLDFTSHSLGISYPPSFLFLLALFFLLMITLHFTTVISRLYDQNKRLAQEVSLLKQELSNEIGKPQRTPSLREDSSRQTPA